MVRCDEGLAFMLQYENVAWYENGAVKILDRRVYPASVEYVTCHRHEEVAKAIHDMVTQSAGPYTAAGMGMALAAFESKMLPKAEQWAYLEKAAYTLSHARPTTVTRMEQVVAGCLRAARQALDEGRSAEEAIFLCTIESLNRRYTTMEHIGEILVEQFPQGGNVLTQCFGEVITGMMLRAAHKYNPNVHIYCAETRPYLQGARLTASCCQDMGFDTTVISDNMIAYTMAEKGIDVFTSASDTITCDGYVANKVGTYQIAIVSKHFGVPFYVTGNPDAAKKTGSDIVIEQRDPEEVLSFRGVKHTLDGVKALYPSFDITPPELITGIITDKGIYRPATLNTYFDTPVKPYY